QYTQRARIAQSSTLPTIVDEPESPLRDVSQEEACHTDSGFIANQDRATIAKSSTLPHDSAPKVTSPAADKGSMQQIINELTAFYTSLQRQHLELLSKFQAQEVEINRGNLDKGEAAAERASDDTEEMATVLTSMDAATVLASGATEVPTGSRSIPTAGPPATKVSTGSDVVPTASPVFATATVIDAQVARELEEQLEREDQRMSEQIARHAEITRIHTKEELQIMIDGLDRNNETIAKYLQEYHQFASELPIERRIELINDLVKYQDNYAKIYKFQSQQRKSWTKKQNKDYYMAVIKSNLGRKRLVNETLSNRPPTSDKEMELWVELSRLYKPDDEDQLWTHTENLMHALVEWKLYDSCGVHHVTAKDKEIFMLGEGSDPPTDPHHTPSPVAQPPSHTTHSSSTLPPVTTTSIPTVTPSETTPIRQYTQRARIAQSSTLPTIADEPKSPLRDVSQEEACHTDSGFIAD
nr:hypothetical protein [Tanacetum cinerariifolium]